jgi:hypothetical protein
MDQNVKIEDVKSMLQIHMELLNKAYKGENYNSIVEHSENVTKLSYLLSVFDK